MKKCNTKNKNTKDSVIVGCLHRQKNLNRNISCYTERFSIMAKATQTGICPPKDMVVNVA